MRGIHCSQREDSREKSYLPQRMHLDFIFPERSSIYQYGAQLCDAIANNLDPLHHGWQLENDILTGIMAEQNIAPLEVVELVACKCKGKYKRSILNIPNNKYKF